MFLNTILSSNVKVTVHLISNGLCGKVFKLYLSIAWAKMLISFYKALFVVQGWHCTIP